MTAVADIDAGDPPPFTGENLLGDRPAPRATFGEALLYGDELKYLQTDRWKLIHRPPKEGVPAWTRLYDVRSDPAERSDLATSYEIREGEAKHALLAAIRDWRPDLVLAGSHGKSPFERLLLGSVSHALVSHAPCSVEIVRATAAT